MRMYQEGKFSSPLESINFTQKLSIILADRMTHKDFTDIKAVIQAYEFLYCHLLLASDKKLKEQLTVFKGDEYAAKSETQVYFLQSLSTVYFEGEAMKRFQCFVDEESEFTDSMRKVMNQMNLLFGLWCLEKHLPTLYDAGFFKGDWKPAAHIREVILGLCCDLKNDAVSLVDTFAPPDFILNSCLGFSDGRVYDHIFEAISKSKNAFDRPDFYEEFTEHKPSINSLRKDHGFSSTSSPVFSAKL